LPPHHPYKPSREFAGQFSGDGWKPPVKPTDLFNEDKTEDFLKKHRAFYDEFVLYVDHEFGRLMDWMESTGVLDDTWVVFTSDHGEMFERGIFAHSTPTLYQPVIRVPLMVFEPGRQTGRDVHAPTSAIDLLPTLLHVTVHNIPDWVEGTVLPPYAPGLLRTDPAVYAVQARYNNPHGPLTEATLMMAVENYKLIYYAGYEELGGNRERIQVFDLQADPEELNDLSSSQPDITADLMEKMRAKKQQVDEPYQ
jgi:choline-sulfatase